MKKVFMLLASLAVVFAMASCGKDNKGGDDNLIDDKGGNTEENLHASLQGSDYYVLLMDGETFGKIEKKVKADIRMQDGADGEATRPLYIWNGYAGGTAEGLNFYGVAGEYMCLQVTAGAGWSGFGHFMKISDPNFGKMKEITGDYYFHFCYKGAANTVHALYPWWGPEASGAYKMSVGEGNEFEDKGVKFEFAVPISNGGKFVANEWNEYEIKVSDMGIDFTAAPAQEDGQNIFCGLSGGVPGTTINLDAVFFYKK
jgi:hypothetical protein